MQIHCINLYGVWGKTERMSKNRRLEQEGGRMKKVEKEMIRPRYKGERGGTLTMSMKKNIPEPKHKDWKLTTCPQCGQQCWESELTRACLKKDKTLKALCTECALGGE